MSAYECREMSRLSPCDAWRGEVHRLSVPRSPSPARSAGWDGQGDVPGLEVSFDSIDIREGLEEERDSHDSHAGRISPK